MKQIKKKSTQICLAQSTKSIAPVAQLIHLKAKWKASILKVNNLENLLFTKYNICIIKFICYKRGMKSSKLK